jgi:hypothetical protein
LMDVTDRVRLVDSSHPPPHSDAPDSDPRAQHLEPMEV